MCPEIRVSEEILSDALFCLLMSHRQDGNGTGHLQPTTPVESGVFSGGSEETNKHGSCCVVLSHQMVVKIKQPSTQLGHDTKLQHLIQPLPAGPDESKVSTAVRHPRHRSLADRQ